MAEADLSAASDRRAQALDSLAELAAHIEIRRPGAVARSEIAHGELTLHVPLAGLVQLVEFLKNDQSCRFSSLVDITAIDHPNRAARFEPSSTILSLSHASNASEPGVDRGSP